MKQLQWKILPDLCSMQYAERTFVSEMSKNGMPQNVVTYRSIDSI